MGAPIIRLFVLIVLMFTGLIFATTWWSVVKADEMRTKTANRRALLQEERIKRGVIRTADGKLIAGSQRIEGERYRRRYPLGDLFGHPVGYSYTRIGRGELERSYNDQLTGRETELVSVLDSIMGRDQVGHDVRTTLVSRAQEVAKSALKGRKGAVVALNVKTGGVLAMYSEPAYDPSHLDDPKVFARLNRDRDAPLLNRATQGQFPPGSAMKVVTAAAALDSGEYKPDTTVDGRNGKEISGVPLNNFGNQDFGEVDLTTALTKSVNTVWAEVAEKLGKDTMADYMERFGFYARPEIDLPPDNVARSGARSERSGRLLSPTSDQIDIGRVGIGQGNLLVTPLQMAMVAQTVANGGVRMQPYLVEEVVDEDGRTVSEHEPEEVEEVISAGTARELTAMMRNVVKEGTGTAAALSGVTVAGKTGTAEINIAQRINHPWFIGFTDEFAVAVMMERLRGATGGTDAAPIAKQVLEALGE